VGNAFLEIYPRLVAAKADQPWTREDKRVQALKRGRYIEFNLLYDRGTKFGLETGGNVDAIFVSLPPGAEW
jgi:coproporphyrinogen III oxidase